MRKWDSHYVEPFVSYHIYLNVTVLVEKFNSLTKLPFFSNTRVTLLYHHMYDSCRTPLVRC